MREVFCYMELIQLIDVTKTYVVDEKEHHALHHFSCAFDKTGLIGVIGKSGSGKSTLLNMISLLDKPTSGDIYFNGQNINKWNEKRKIEYRNKDMGIIFQHYHLIEQESVLFNIYLPYLIGGGNEKDGKEKAKKLLESIHYRKDLYEQKVFNLSGGEKERVAVLRALINDPKFLLCDEPTGALDSRNSLLTMELLKEISKRKLVIVVSHNLPLIKQYADKLIEIKDGKIIDSLPISRKRRRTNE